MAAQYRIRKFRIRKDDALYLYCDKITSDACSLTNAVRFRQRQVYIGVRKDPAEVTANEAEVFQEIRTLIAAYPEFRMPSVRSPYMSYKFMEKLMRITKNPDFFAEELPMQTSQNIVKQCVTDMKAYGCALKSWKESPESFTGKPELPGYVRKGGHVTCAITNQDAVLYTNDKTWELKLPCTKIRLNAGPVLEGARLKEAKIIPDNGSYVIAITLEEEMPDITMPETNSRIAAIDLGVNNLMAVTNNCGLPCLLYRGGIPKSINQYYNKKLAKIVSEQTIATGKKFVPTEESQSLTLHRNDSIHDFMHKVAKHFITWCVENRIDTIVVGVNKQFKQESNLGRINNQNFVQLPFLTLRNMLQYLAARNGISYTEHEESYTSKASFPDNDAMPVYGQEKGVPVFSGKRRPTSYKGMYRKEGFRGLFTTSKGVIINSDLNGSANILRKAFPNAFANGACLPCFSKVTIIVHPDSDNMRNLKSRQLAARKGVPASKSKLKRERRKAVA